MKRTTQTAVRTALLALALINQVLSAFGKSPLPIEDAEAETFFTLCLTLGAALWSWWKNNSLTQKARLADGFLDRLKQGMGEERPAGKEEALGMTAEEREDENGL